MITQQAKYIIVCKRGKANLPDSKENLVDQENWVIFTVLHYLENTK